MICEWCVESKQTLVPQNVLNCNRFFYDNCLISRAMIGSFLSSLRVRTDKILIYASFQQLNVQLSNCQPFNQCDFIVFLKEPIKKREKLSTMLASF